MSFHEDSFHETKRERKKYENKKQKALTYIDQTRAELLRQGQKVLEDSPEADKFMSAIHNKLRDITSYVNDI